MIRSMAPVSSRLFWRSSRFFVTGLASAAKRRRSSTSGSVRTSAGRPRSVASPRLRSAGRAAFENGPSWRISRLMSGAAVFRSRATGVNWSARAPRSAISGRSSRRKPGRRSIDASMSSRRSALASATVFAWTMKSETRSFSRASGASTASESDASWPSTRFWRARILSARSVSRSAGLARWITSFSSSPRPARPTPSSPSRIASRSRWGRRRMLLTRSRSTGELVPPPAGCLQRQLVLAVPHLLERLRRSSCPGCTPRTSRRSATAGGPCSARPGGTA